MRADVFHVREPDGRQSISPAVPEGEEQKKAGPVTIQHKHEKANIFHCPMPEALSAKKGSWEYAHIYQLR